MFKRYKELREEKGKTQKEIAQIIGVTVSSYKALEEGHAPRFDPDALCRLADFYDVSLDYICERTDIRNLHKFVDEEVRNIISNLK